MIPYSLLYLVLTPSKITYTRIPYDTLRYLTILPHICNPLLHAEKLTTCFSFVNNWFEQSSTAHIIQSCPQYC